MDGFFTVLSELQGKPISFIVGFKSLVVSKAPPILPPAHDEALDHLQCYGWRGNEGGGGGCNYNHLFTAATTSTLYPEHRSPQVGDS